MIIKIEANGRKLFFDRIQHVSSGMVNCTTREDLEGMVLRADYDNINLPSPNEEGKIDFSFHWMIVQRETLPPSSLVLAMEGDVYLLNDINGKTIERL